MGEGAVQLFRGFPSGLSWFWVLVLVLRVSAGDGSVSACALAPGARGGDVEEGLGLPQLGPSPQVAHVGCGGLCV